MLGAIGGVLGHTKAELLKTSLEKGIIWGSVTAGRAFKFPQYGERKFWIKVEHPELGTYITYPGVLLNSARPNAG